MRCSSFPTEAHVRREGMSHTRGAFALQEYPRACRCRAQALAPHQAAPCNAPRPCARCRWGGLASGSAGTHTCILKGANTHTRAQVHQEVGTHVPMRVLKWCGGRAAGCVPVIYSGTRVESTYLPKSVMCTKPGGRRKEVAEQSMPR